MKLIALMLALVGTSALAQTCDYYPLTTCQQQILGRKIFLDGIEGNIYTDGGTTFNGDAGFNNVSMMNLVVRDGGHIGPFLLQGATANSGKITLDTSSNPELDMNDTVGDKLIYAGDYIQLFGDHYLRVGADAGILVNGVPVATAANGQAGGSLFGYLNLASGHASTAVNGVVLAHPINKGSASLCIVTTAAGTVGGTLQVRVLDVTSGVYLATGPTVSCTSSSGGCSTVGLDSGVVGDTVSLIVDTTSCTGVDPVGGVSASW